MTSGMLFLGRVGDAGLKQRPRIERRNVWSHVLRRNPFGDEIMRKVETLPKRAQRGEEQR